MPPEDTTQLWVPAHSITAPIKLVPLRAHITHLTGYQTIGNMLVEYSRMRTVYSLTISLPSGTSALRRRTARSVLLPAPSDIAIWHTHPYEGNIVQFLGDRGAEYGPVPGYVTTPIGSSFGTFLIGPWQGGILVGGEYGPPPANIEMMGPPHVAAICQLSGPAFNDISHCH